MDLERLLLRAWLLPTIPVEEARETCDRLLALGHDNPMFVEVVTDYDLSWEQVREPLRLAIAGLVPADREAALRELARHELRAMLDEGIPVEEAAGRLWRYDEDVTNDWIGLDPTCDFMFADAPWLGEDGYRETLDEIVRFAYAPEGSGSEDR